MWQPKEVVNVTKQQTLIFQKVARNHHGTYTISYFQGHDRIDSQTNAQVKVSLELV